MAKTITAYGVYTYNTSPASGMSGRIIDQGGTSVTVDPNLDTGLGGDPQVEGFVDPGGNLRICSTERVTSGTASNTIFNAVTESVVNTPTWAEIDNLYGLVTLGSYVYALDYDNACVVEINPASSYAETGKKYTYATAHSGYTARGQALLKIGSTLFALFSVPKNDWTDYKPSVLVKLAVVANTSITAANINDTGVEKNAFAMAANGNFLYIASIGGTQSNSGYNANSKIQVVNHTGNLSTVSTAMSNGAGFPYEFRDISFKGSTAYILAGAYNGSWNLAGKLVSTTNFSTLTTIDDFTAGVAGYYWAAQYISDNDRLFYARGNAIRVIDAADNSVDKTLAMSDLGSSYTNLDAMSYVGVDTSTARSSDAAISVPRAIRGYRSPLQASVSKRAVLARQITRGRPELDAEELQQLEAKLVHS